MTLIVGIDPGFSGAIALLEPGPMTLTVHDMPTFKDKSGKTLVNLFQMATLLNPSAMEVYPKRLITVIEKVHAMPNQGISSAFRFGEGYGALQMACVGHGYEMHYVSPSNWKKHFGLSSKKDTSRGLATQRFPGASKLFTRVKDDGRAEAALMALYGHEKILLNPKGAAA